VQVEGAFEEQIRLSHRQNSRRKPKHLPCYRGSLLHNLPNCRHQPIKLVPYPASRPWSATLSKLIYCNSKTTIPSALTRLFAARQVYSKRLLGMLYRSPARSWPTLKPGTDVFWARYGYYKDSFRASSSSHKGLWLLVLCDWDGTDEVMASRSLGHDSVRGCFIWRLIASGGAKWVLCKGDMGEWVLVLHRSVCSPRQGVIANTIPEGGERIGRYKSWSAAAFARLSRIH
jgi:hypothetical protein